MDQRSELAELGTALRESRSGTGGIVLIEGAAGSGKSELLETFAARAEHDGATVLSAASSDTDRTMPLSTLRQLLDHTPDIAWTDLPVTDTGALTRQ
ncbi:ATP-binding protein, partial [Kitasatospora sp. NPDC050463]|uniref:ATP-binding protein n=1 Tax=Kitasatospora sp. NPDC050463 TaxID=3155786 RepID=UPI0033EA92B2